jgi:predicted molibdopterin-dependent oxidoreductase YjgC
MFKRVEDLSPDLVNLLIEGKRVSARRGDTVAAAMLIAGFAHNRTTPISGANRAPFCMMGICFDCLVEIDGIPNQQACQTLVQAGMRVKLQKGARKLCHD